MMHSGASRGTLARDFSRRPGLFLSPGSCPSANEDSASCVHFTLYVVLCCVVLCCALVCSGVLCLANNVSHGLGQLLSVVAMRIVSWNVNGLGPTASFAKYHHGSVRAWLDSLDADIVCVQVWQRTLIARRPRMGADAVPGCAVLSGDKSDA